MSVTGDCTSPYIGPSAAGVCGSYLFMSILDDYIRNHTDISGLCERIHPITIPDKEYDFIVVGGGSGGATVAGRLAALRKWKVLLIEAGNDEPPGSEVPAMYPSFVARPEMNWNYKTEPEKNACFNQPQKRCATTRGKVLGGCSTINGMMYMRGIPTDFQRWVKAGNHLWSYEQVLPYFKSMESNLQVGTVADPDYHGTEGSLTVSTFRSQPAFTTDLLSAAEQQGFPLSKDLNGNQITGFSVCQATNRNGTRLSASKAFVWPQRDNPYLDVMLNTTATKLILTRRRRQVEVNGVRMVYKNQTFTVKARKEVIISGGAINSPQLLLLSGIGPRRHLKSMGIPRYINLPGVGRNLQNHVSMIFFYALTKLNNTNDLTWEALKAYLSHQDGPMSSTGLSQISARLNSKYAQEDGTWPDLQFFFNGFAASCGVNGSPLAPDSDSPYKTMGIAPVLLHPKSRGHVELKSRDPLAAPAITGNYLTHSDDVKTMIDSVRLTQKLVDAPILKEKYGISLLPTNYSYCSEKFEYDCDDFWRCVVSFDTFPENHFVGTCRMGTDSMAVVNQQLLVIGTRNLRVIDASVMPEVISGNTAATTMMIAERGVQFIRDRYCV